MLSLSTRLASVCEATDADAREAIYSLRYAVMVEERGRVNVPGLDHTGRRCATAGDEQAHARHFFTRAGDQLDAALRLRRWAPGVLPDRVRETYSLDLVANIDDLAVAEVSRIVARAAAPSDGRLAILALFRACFEACLEPEGADLLVFDVHPALVGPFARLLGARRYGGELTRRSGGARVPMVVVVSDCAHFERVGSLFTPLAWKTFVLGRRPRIDVGRFAERFVDDRERALEADEDWPLLEQRFFRRGVERRSLFHGLRPGIVEELLARGSVRELGEGEVLLDQDQVGGELYVILDGCFELRSAGHGVDVAGQGEIVGEVGLLSPTTPAFAEVRALIPSKVLALGPQALRKLALGDPEAGYRVMFNLARFLAERFSEKTRLVEHLDLELDRLRGA